MAMQAQLQIRQNAQEMQEYMKDLFQWEKEVKKKEAAATAPRRVANTTQSTSTSGNTVGKDNSLPAVRGRADNTKIAAAPADLQRPALDVSCATLPTSGKVSRLSQSCDTQTKFKHHKEVQGKRSSVSAAAHTHYNYSKWDKFDVDKALELGSSGSEDEAAPSPPIPASASGPLKLEPQPTSESFRAAGPAPVSLPRPSPAAAAAAPLAAAVVSAAATAPVTIPAQLPKELPIRNSEPQDADGWRKRGNDLFKVGQFVSARECYTRSILLEPSGCLGYANRAMAAIKLCDWAAAEDDCTQALALDSSYVKAWQRRGAARRQLGHILAAAEDFEAALRLEPTSQILLAERDACLSEYMQANRLQHLAHRVPLAVATAATQAASSPGDAAQDSVPAVLDAEQPVPPARGATASATGTPMAAAGNGARPKASPAAASNGTAASGPVKATAGALAAAAAGAAELLSQRRHANAAAGTSQKTPVTSIEFESVWRSLRGDVTAQQAYLRLLQPSQLPTLFKSSLTAPLLFSILEALLMPPDAAAAASSPAALSSVSASFLAEFLEQLCRVPRFDLTAMSVSSRDRALLQPLWGRAIGQALDAGEEEMAVLLKGLQKRYRLA